MISELGGYRISGHNGQFIPLAKSLGFNHAYVGAGADAGASEVLAVERAANLKALLKKLAKKGFKITLDLERHSPTLGFKQVLKAAAPVWGSVTRIVLADEAPKLDYHAWAYKVDVAIHDMGLALKPIGAVFTPRQIIDKEISNAELNAFMFVGIEAYCDIPLTAPDPAMQVRNLMHRVADRLGDMPKVFIAAAYNRNGAFTDPAQILAVNDEAWEWAEAYDSPLYAFALGRTGGLKDLPFLQEWYKSRG